MRSWKGHLTSPPWGPWTSTIVTSVCTEVQCVMIQPNSQNPTVLQGHWFWMPFADTSSVSCLFCCGFRWYNTNRGWKRHIWGGEEVGAVQVSFLWRSVQKTKIAVMPDVLKLWLCAFAGSVREPREFQPQIWSAGCYWWPKHTTATL